jgi:GNAT superfamily N-acetyltransferase
MQISNLRDVPHFADTIADRGWHAWWTDSGVPLSVYRAGLDPMIAGRRIPFCLVAHHDQIYLGSVLVIENDFEARPKLAPWIAALWVEPAHRNKGIAVGLISAARTALAGLGVMRCYLCATPDNSPYYLARGFTLVEGDITGLNILEIDAGS